MLFNPFPTWSNQLLSLKSFNRDSVLMIQAGWTTCNIRIVREINIHSSLSLSLTHTYVNICIKAFSSI